MNSASLLCIPTPRALDIQPRNILMGVLNDSELVQFEHDGKIYPSPRKELSTHTVYRSRPLPLAKAVHV
jgi:serine/threonine-protein kinase SRPK3